MRSSAQRRESTSGSEDGQRAHRGDKHKPSPAQLLNCLPSQHLRWSRFNALTFQRFNVRKAMTRPSFFPSGIPRYWVNVCDWYHMPLEPCPTCGYALSTVDHHCRHCLPSRSASAKAGAPFHAKHLQQMIMAAVVFGVVVYLIFFR